MDSSSRYDKVRRDCPFAWWIPLVGLSGLIAIGGPISLYLEWKSLEVIEIPMWPYTRMGEILFVPLPVVYEMPVFEMNQVAPSRKADVPGRTIPSPEAPLIGLVGHTNGPSFGYGSFPLKGSGRGGTGSQHLHPR